MNVRSRLLRFGRGRGPLALAAAAAIAALGGDCDRDIAVDPTFRDWCGDTLCSWTRDSGRIQRVPTWNENDFGVSFLDPGTRIHQTTPEHDATCVLFTAVADIDPTAQMELDVDFNNDGTVDARETLGSTDWHRLEAEITAPARYSGITFSVQKKGAGTAILAEMRIQATSDCSAPASFAPFLFGEGCTANDQCAAGLVCDDHGLCGECNAVTRCAGGGACGRVGNSFPEECDPGTRSRNPGEVCVQNRDCASGVCEGADVQSVAKIFGSDASGVCLPSWPGDPACTPVAGAQDQGECQCVYLKGGTCR